METNKEKYAKKVCDGKKPAFTQSVGFMFYKSYPVKILGIYTAGYIHTRLHNSGSKIKTFYSYGNNAKAGSPAHFKPL